ncbi:25S rRNA (adenine645-N1)-methyltransferase [Binucleata daphniae]
MKKNHTCESKKVAYKTCNKSKLQIKLEEQLQPSIFRIMNEKMYKSKKKQHKFDYEAYHTGYKMQVGKWPMNPLDVIIKYLKNKDCVIADFGCGEAKLEQALNCNVISLDLNLKKGIKCDIRKTPIKNKSVDYVIFCLSIMNNDAFEYIQEASRVCKNKGKMIVGEIKNRMKNFDVNVKKIGFEKTKVLEENNYFVVYEYTKIKDSTTVTKIPMKTCDYKKR